MVNTIESTLDPPFPLICEYEVPWMIFMNLLIVKKLLNQYVSGGDKLEMTENNV